MIRTKTLLLGIATILVSFGAFAKDCGKIDFADISKQELQKLVKAKKVVTIDANSRESFESARIGDAIHFGSSKAKIKTLLQKRTHQNKDALVVAYCGGPRCMAWKKAARAACRAGYTNVKHFKGGISGWKQAG